MGLTLGTLPVSGCAGYESTSAPLGRALDEGRRAVAVKGLNDALGVGAADDGRFADGPDAPLVLLERAMVLLAEGRHGLSARDFQAADADLEVLDLDGDAVGSLGRYLWSDAATVYRAPPYEKTILNTLNMLNYLVMGHLSGARVEARRLIVSERHLGDQEDVHGLSALGAYLSGFTFERSGRWDQAMRHYADAKVRGGVPTLEAAIEDLHRRTGAWDRRLGDRPPPSPVPAAVRSGQGEILVVVGTGRAPYRFPERVPLGLGVAYLTTPTCAPHCLNPAQRTQARRVAAQGLTTWLNYPGLRRVRPRVTGADVHIGGQPAVGASALDLEALAMSAFERSKGVILLAAFSRAVTRALAGAGAETLVRSAAGDQEGGGLAGLLAGLLVEGLMVAADVPDTRSWSSLPARLHVFRARVPAGAHRVQIRLHGPAAEEVVREVEVEAGGYVVVTHVTLR